MARPDFARTLSLLNICMLLCLLHGQGSAAEYERLAPITDVTISQCAKPYPGGRHEAANLRDEDSKTEYSSDGAGTNTFVEFDFGKTTRIDAFQHVDRNDPATIARSELKLMDDAGQVVSTIEVTHPNTRAGEAFVRVPGITARRARWQVTQLGSPHGTVGGASVSFYRVAGVDATPTALKMDVHPLQMLERNGGQSLQPLQVTVHSPYATASEVVVRLRGTPFQQTANLRFGRNQVRLLAPPVDEPTPIALEVIAGAQKLAETSLVRQPVRKLVIYLLAHSHVDIGYTALQADVEKKQNENLEIALKLARDTANYPEGARFKWNMEVLWPVENYLRTAPPEKKKAFLEAVSSGQVGLDAFYGNVLTGLCRPEELLRLMTYATEMSAMCGLPIESAMISDVPGYTWSTVSAMAHAGVKYFSFAPNYFDRMGGTMKEWQNRPFWWVGPDGKSKVLCWCPSRGYALGHLIGDGQALAKFLPDYVTELETTGYGYDISHLRWNVHGDNGSPDEKVADVVKEWNAKYAYPQLVMSTTAEAFRAFEKRYGKDLPVYAGDYTPYWEDGAGSSALETAMNRASAERLVQAETLWALGNPGAYPTGRFQEAWRNVLLYSEHTWGAHNSISQPDLPFVRDQWKVKKAFAVDADRQSRELLAEALGCDQDAHGTDSFEVLNTSSWERTDLVTLPAESSRVGDRVVDAKGNPVPSQRLSSGELAFLAEKLPAFSSRVYTVKPGGAHGKGKAMAEGSELSNAAFKVVLHEQTVGVKSLYSRSLKRELAKTASPTGINEFYYLIGADVSKAQKNGVPMIRVKENGPLVASLLVESAAPGARLLSREVRLVDGLDRIEFINTIDKLPVREKEGVHFGYDFEIPEPRVRMDVGLAVVRPEEDQIPASCKNWFSVQRWVDVANEDYGITWVPVDAPLVQMGGMTANLIGSQTDWRVWIQNIEPSTRLYSWVMNNHWHTNYRADQEGPTAFRYHLRAHKGYSAASNSRFGAEASQPLLVRAAAKEPRPLPSLALSTDDVVVTALKPADDGTGWVVRLYGASGETHNVRLKWRGKAPEKVYLSDLSEKPFELVKGAVTVPAWGVVTLRAE